MAFAWQILYRMMVALAALAAVAISLPGFAAEPYVAVLGIAQDAGYPQAGCVKECCRLVWSEPSRHRSVACLAIVDPDSRQRWMVDCTPDFPKQMNVLDKLMPTEAGRPLDGILLTHAHIGHYAGLIHLGREVMGAQSIPVYAMPRMRFYLESNGPWRQMVRLNQIAIQRMAPAQVIKLNDRISIRPFLVPHRDEFSETVGFLIAGPSRKLAYIPDIDKWEHWHRSVETMIAGVDVALLDGTFYDNAELPGRNMEKIPHPFIVESIQRFQGLPLSERKKIQFIHLNHTNPVLQSDSESLKGLKAAAMRVASQVNPDDVRWASSEGVIRL